jgi:hypothetical protein
MQGCVKRARRIATTTFAKMPRGGRLVVYAKGIKPVTRVA